MTIHSTDAKADLFLEDARLLRQLSLPQGLPEGLAELALDLGQSKMLLLNLPFLSS